MTDWFPIANLILTIVAIVQTIRMIVATWRETRYGEASPLGRAILGSVALFVAMCALLLPALAYLDWVSSDVGRFGSGLARGVVIVVAEAYLRWRHIERLVAS